MLRAIKLLVVGSLIVLVQVEALLRVFDPWGIGVYADNLRTVYEAFTPNETRDFVMRSGFYTFRGWNATVLPDGTRLVPGTNRAAPCRVLLVGDSMTFGMSASDGDTWPSLIAPQLPGVHLINAGVISYQIDEVAASIPDYAADAVIYLLIGNDNERRSQIQSVPYAPYLALYLRDLMDHPSGAQYMSDADFYGKVHDLLDQGVTVVGFDQGLAREAHERFPAVILIPPYTQRTSPSDSHPNPAGNREIAVSMLPVVRQAMRERCTAVF